MPATKSVKRREKTPKNNRQQYLRQNLGKVNKIETKKTDNKYIITRISDFMADRKNVLAAIFLLCITALVFFNSLNNKFTNWDDNALIVNNQAIRSLSWNNIEKMFDITRGGTYQPVRVLSYAIDYHFSGLKPFLYHVHNILLHGLASVFLFFALINILPALLGKEYEHIFGIAFLTSILFAVHPVNVEAVSWLSDRKYVLLAFFSFTGFYFFSLQPKNKWQACLFTVLALLCSMLAAFSSPFGVVLPALFFLYEYCASNELNPIKIIRKRPGIFLPFIALGLAIAVLLWIKLVGQRMSAIVYFRGDIIYTLYTLMQSLFDYMRNIFFPFWLNNRYVDYIYLSPFEYYKIPLGFLGLCIVISFCIYQFKKGKRFYLFCIGWFLISLSPASNIIPIAIKMADRYIYLASPGIFLLVSYSIFNIKEKYCADIPMRYLWYAGIAFIVSGCCALSVQRNYLWKDSISLWTDSINKDPRNPIAWNDLGAALFTKGKLKRAEFCFRNAIRLNGKGKLQLINLAEMLLNERRLNEAAVFYKQLIKVDPNSVAGYSALGEIYLRLGKPKLARFYIDKVLSMNPDNPKAIAQKGNLLFAMGSGKAALALYNKALVLFPKSPELNYNKAVVLEKLNFYKAALKALSKAIDLEPKFPEALNLTGQIYFEQGNFKKAEEYFKKAISYHAGLYDVYNNLGNLYEKQGLFKKALVYYEKALEIRPDFIQALYNRCLVLDKLGSSDNAAICYENILKKNPEHAESLNNLGHIYAEKKQYKKAMKFFRKALKNKKNFADAHYNLARLLELEGSSDAAIFHYKKVLDADPDDMEALNNLAFIYDHKGEVDKAIDIFYRMLKITPNRSSIHFNLGLLLARKGETKEAVAQFIEALKLDPKNKVARDILERSHIHIK